MFRKKYQVNVTTGCAKGAGTNANITINLIDSRGQISDDVSLDKWLKDDFEYGSEETYSVHAPHNFETIQGIRLHRDEAGFNDSWFVQHVAVKHCEEGEVHFPLNRWLPANTPMTFTKYDAQLPQQVAAKYPKIYEQRTNEIKQKAKAFAFTPLKIDGVVAPGMPRTPITLPPEENFSREYQLEVLFTGLGGSVEQIIKKLRYSDEFKSFDDMFKLFFGIANPFDVPKGHSNWRTDEKFAALRLTGPNAVMIKGCKKFGGIPANFKVEEEKVALFLEGKSLKVALCADRLFFCSYEDLEDYIVNYSVNHKTKKGPMVCPFGLFYSRDDGVLIPLAIQLFQKPGPKNPVFYPAPVDEERLWCLAKFWFGVADSNYHEPVTHLLNTHLVAGDFITCFHSTVSPSHPIYKLMLPHFIYLLNINTTGMPILIAEDGAFNNILLLGRDNCNSLMIKKFKEFSLMECGWFPTEIENRGVDNLKNYHFREDSEKIFRAIHTYISKSVATIYNNDDDLLADDIEMNNFVALLTEQKEGVDPKTIWGQNGKFEKIDDLARTLTSIVFILTSMHAAANFNQYDEYGYTPNLPFRLREEPPTSKDTSYLTEDWLVKLFDVDIMLDTMVLGQTLSLQGTNKIGDFEVQYGYKPQILVHYEQFLSTLSEISKDNDEINARRRFPYPWLSPKVIPNSISI